MAMSSTMILRMSRIAICAALAVSQSTFAWAALYWDANGALPGGSNSSEAPGAWGSDAFWSIDQDGNSATGAWVADETAVFSASNNVTGAFDVAVNGTQSANGINFEEGTVTLTGGTVNLTGTATVTVGPGLTSTINSDISGSAGLRVAGGDLSTLVLNGANNYTGATALASSASGPNILRIGANEVIPDSSVVQILGQNAILDLNGKTETVKSIANVGGGPFTNSRIDIGAGNLIINDDAGQSETYAITLASSTTGKLTKNGQGTLVLTSSNTGWFGEVVLNSGTLSLGANNTIGRNTDAAAKLTFNGGTLTNANANSKSLQTLNYDITNSFTALMNGANFELLGGAASGEGTAVITLKTANPAITVNNTAGTSGVFIFRGTVGEDAPGRGFTKRGPGTLTIANPNNSWTGATVVEEGQLRVDANGRIGDGTGALILAGGNFATAVTRDVTTAPISNPIAVTQDSAIVTVFGGANPLTNTTDANFTGPFSGVGGTLTFRNDAPNNATNNVTQFEPQLSADFTFSQPIVIAAGLINSTRTTRLNSANPGVQTLSGPISGPGKYRRMAGGTTIFNGANIFSGGVDVEGGSLVISGASATAGSGDISVTGGTLSIAAGVANAIADAATLNISGGIVNLGVGVNELVGGLVLGGDVKGNGTYGSTASSADFKSDQYFSGTGILTIGAAHISGDFNNDTKVDSADFNIWKGQFGDQGIGLAADEDQNGAVDGHDFLAWQANFGFGVGGGATAISEPAAGGLAATAFGGLLGVRRRKRYACHDGCNRRKQRTPTS